MGPRPFSRGNLMPLVALENLDRLQWGHDISAVETGSQGRQRHSGQKGFNGATTFQPWKLQSTMKSSPKSLSFNGATTFQPWKHGQEGPDRRRHPGASMGPRPFSRGNPNERHRRAVLRYASMGPRPFSRGNGPSGPSIERVRLGFNGATTFQPRKR